MANAPIVHIGENSPEQVALKLLEAVAKVERKLLYPAQNPEPDTVASRKWILDTYGECLEAVKGGRVFARDAR